MKYYTKRLDINKELFVQIIIIIIIIIIMLDKLPFEIIIMVMKYLDNYQDQIDIALTCKTFFNVFIGHNSLLKIDVNITSKYYTNILINLIKNYNLNTKSITINANLQYLPYDVIRNYNFAYVNLNQISSLSKYERNTIVFYLFLKKHKDEINDINYDFEFSLKENNCTEDYYLNNIHNDQDDDYYVLLGTKTYDIPWYVTKLKFGLDYTMIKDNKEVSRINSAVFLKNNQLVVYNRNNDCQISNNSVSTDNLDEWSDKLIKNYKYLKNVTVSKKIISCDKINNYNASIGKEFLITNNYFKDPVFKFDFIEKFSIAFIISIFFIYIFINI